MPSLLLLISPVKDVALRLRPEFVPGVRAHAARKTFGRAQQGMLNIRLAIWPPRIRQKVIPRNCDESRIRGREIPVRTPREKRHLDYIFYAPAKRILRHWKISRILAPQRAEPGFHHVTGGHSGKAHSESFAKSSPVRTVLARMIQRRAHRRRDHASRKVLRPKRVFNDPAEPLLPRDRKVRRALACALIGAPIWGERRRVRQ